LCSICTRVPSTVSPFSLTAPAPTGIYPLSLHDALPISGGTGGIPVTMLLVAALYLGDQIYAILFVQDNVANFMHIVGGVCGTAFGFYSACARPRRKRSR